MILSGSGLVKIKYATFDEMNPKFGQKYDKYRPYKGTRPLASRKIFLVGSWA